MKYENKSDKSIAHVRRWREVNLAMAKNKKKLKLFYFQQIQRTSKAWVSSAWPLPKVTSRHLVTLLWFLITNFSQISNNFERISTVFGPVWRILIEKFAILSLLLVCFELGHEPISNIRKNKSNGFHLKQTKCSSIVRTIMQYWKIKSINKFT